MPLFRKKPVVVAANQWWKNGDHPDDFSDRAQPDIREVEGMVVRYYRSPDEDHAFTCAICGDHMNRHGWIDTLEGGHIVCPGDWIITGIKGEMYPCKPDVFEQTHELV